MKVRGVRGATTAAENTSDAIVEATAELLEEMVRQNNIVTEDLAVAEFTVTHDLDAEFPAVAARVRLGWENVPLLCFQEIPVPNDQPRSIRTLLLVNTDKGQSEIVHVYLRDAANLRGRGREGDRRSAS